MARFSLVSVLALGCTFPGDPVVYDLDKDGYLLGADCDDRNPQVFPTAEEQCNGVDDNCDFVIDEGVGIHTYRDADLDGYGDPADALDQCSIPRGWTDVANDCLDTNAAVHPGAPEVCDGLDNNCDTREDEDLSFATHYADIDRDGFGDGTTAATACNVPVGRVASGDDCDDRNPGVNPGAAEVCDTIDQNCNGVPDEGLAIPQYVDGDQDTWGNDAAPVAACPGVEGFAPRGGDCDDSNAEVLPAGDEICDGNDDNCNGVIDEGLTSTFFLDADGDGFGSTISTDACSAPPSYVTNSTDCDDLEGANFPGNTEICDYRDNNCDAEVDEGMDLVWYADADGDGLGDPWARIDTCQPPATHVRETGDCDDSDAAIPPNCPTTLFGQWAGIGGDARRSGYALGTVGIGQLSSLWTENLGGAVDPVAIADGRIFATVGNASDGDSAIVALDASNGSELWRVDAPFVDWMSGPTVVGDKVCLTLADASIGTVGCYDVATGDTVWAKAIASSTSQYMAPLAFDGRLYSGAGSGTNGTLYAHNLVTGGETFEINLFTPTAGWGAAGWNGSVYVWEGDPGTIHAMPEAVGADSPITVSGVTYAGFTSTVGNALVISEDGIGYVTGTNALAAYDLGTRASKFSANTGIVLNGFPAVEGGVLYGVKTTGTAAAWDGNTGALLQNYVGPTGLVGPPIVTDDALIVASPSSTWVLDRFTGAILDNIAAGGSLAVGENRLVLADSAGNVRGYSW